MDPAIQALITASASFLFVSLLFAAAVLLCRKPNKTHSRALSLTSRSVAAGTPPPPPLSTITTVPAGPEETSSFNPSIKQISMPKLVVALRKSDKKEIFFVPKRDGKKKSSVASFRHPLSISRFCLPHSSPVILERGRERGVERERGSSLSLRGHQVLAFS